MSRLTITVGLPGSGKSTWAGEQHASDPSIVIVNRDSIRLELGAQFNWKHEKRVARIRDERIETALNAGYDVIDDDTNLTTHTQAHLRALAERCGADFIINDTFIHTVTFEECMERDRFRGMASVGKDVIERLYYSYWNDQIRPENKGVIRAVVCDVDGTLAHAPGRWNYDRDVTQDTPDNAITSLLNSVALDNKHMVLLVSGRHEAQREPTLEWLRTHNIPCDRLFMRADGDNRNDAVIKKELYLREIQGKYYVEYVIDDRPRVIRMWRGELGLTVLQVGPNYEF